MLKKNNEQKYVLPWAEIKNNLIFIFHSFIKKLRYFQKMCT